jgi:hypothetical protein
VAALAETALPTDFVPGTYKIGGVFNDARNLIVSATQRFNAL